MDINTEWWTYCIVNCTVKRGWFCTHALTSVQKYHLFLKAVPGWTGWDYISLYVISYFPIKLQNMSFFFLQITICLIPKLWLKNQVKPNYLRKSSFICQQCKILNVRNVLVKHDRHKLDLSLTLWGHGIYLVLVSHLHAEQVVKP